MSSKNNNSETLKWFSATFANLVVSHSPIIQMMFLLLGFFVFVSLKDSGLGHFRKAEKKDKPFFLLLPVLCRNYLLETTWVLGFLLKTPS